MRWFEEISPIRLEVALGWLRHVLGRVSRPQADGDRESLEPRHLFLWRHLHYKEDTRSGALQCVLQC